MTLLKGLPTLGLGVLLLGTPACRGGTSDSVTVPEPANGSSEPLAQPPGPPPPPSGSFLALLSPEQMAPLKELGVPIVVPSVIPAGFVVAQVNADAGTGEDSVGDRQYQILYQDGGDRCFVVEFVDSGVGDIPATTYRIPIQPPLFPETDYALNYGPYRDADLQAQFPAPELTTDWLQNEAGFYRFAGAAYINDILAPPRPCKDVTPDEAVQIVESLAVLTEDIGGDN